MFCQQQQKDFEFFSRATVVGAPVGIASARFTIVFSLNTGIIKKLLSVTRNQNERQIKIEKHPNCKFFHRINPDAEGFDIFLENSKILN